MASRCRPDPTPSAVPEGLRLTEILQRLAAISPQDVEDLRILAEDTLRRRWAALAYHDTMRPH